MRDPKKLKELILEKVSLTDVMLGYSVRFTYSPKYTDEVQFSCPFHGKDTKPSARLYKQTQTCYCWTCKKKWDVISFIGEKEGLSYIDSIKFILTQYKVDVSSIPDDLEFEVKEYSVSNVKVGLMHLKSSLLDVKGKLELKKYAALCTAFLMVAYKASLEVPVEKDMKKLEDKIMGAKELCQKS